MSNNNIFKDFDELFNRLSKVSVGFEPLFKDFRTTESSGYPPHNIYKKDETTYVLEIAVAGFKTEEIQLEEHDGTLTVRGAKADSQEPDYLHRGIGARSFVRRFRLAEHFNVEAAKLEDGILTVQFKLDVPEDVKPRLIPILK